MGFRLCFSAQRLSPEPFVVVAGSNDKLVVLVDDTTTITVTFTAGASRTGDQMCADINAAFDGVYGVGLSPFIAEPYYAPLKFDGFVNVTAANTLESVQPTFPLDPLGQSYLQVGDKITFYASLSTGTYTISAINPALVKPQEFVVSPSTLVVGTEQTIQAGGPLRRVRIVPRDKRQACLAKSKVQIKTGVLCKVTGQDRQA